MSARADKLARVFDAAAEMAPAERAAFLVSACGQDQQLRAEVEELLKHDNAGGSFLGKPALAASATGADASAVTEGPGTVIGAYKLKEQIGEGGMGLVFVAEQQHPVRRKVAIKVIKPGMDSREVIARFEAERQALALMDHPNIAKVFEAGATESGRPYFVMELVRGVDILQFCDENRLTPRERLELFVHVCQAVQHAHNKGIIHRDLKATNILVTLHDGTPVVKVIDFGVAKAIGHQLTDKTIYTRFAQMIGTPMYMSPEQAELSGLDIDTRSDIYALGVLLYELLTGMTPFDKDRLKTATYDEIRRIVREEEPPRPSQRISTLLAESLTAVSALRRTDPKRLCQLFRGELDWIVMKALEKDRNRRYETASAFADDVERYLKDEQVRACPPSAGYRLRKLARRNRGPVLVASLVFLVLLGGVAGTTFGMIRAIQAEQKTQDALERMEREQDAAVQALRETFDALIDLSDFNSERLMKDRRPMSIPEQEFFARMEARYERLAVLLSDAEDTRVRSESRIGATGMKLGDVNRGRLAWQRAAALYRGPLAANSANTATAASELRANARRCRAVALAAEKLRRWPEAIEFARRQIELAQAALQPGESLDLELDNLMLTGNWCLTVSLTAAGRFDEARAAWEEMVRLVAWSDQRINNGACEHLGRIAMKLSAAGIAVDPAAILAPGIAERRARLTADQTATKARFELRQAYRFLGLVLEKSRKFPEALDAFDKVIALGDAPPDGADFRIKYERDLVFGSILGRAVCLDALGREADAEAAWEALYKFAKGTAGNWFTFRTMRLAAYGQPERAVRLTEEALLRPGSKHQYNAACVYAIASADSGLLPNRREGLAHRAVTLLEEARVAGYFNDPKKVAHAKTDEDLDPVRGRDEFKKLMATLEAGKK